MELNEKLATLRHNNGYSTRELGEKLGVSQSSISLWEKGSRRPDMEMLVKIANFYGVSTDYLLGSEENSNKSELVILNEKINTVERNANLMRKEISELEEQLKSHLRILHADRNYLKVLEEYNYSNIEENNKVDQKLSDMVSERIINNRQEIKKHEYEVSIRRKKLNELNDLLKDLYSKIHAVQHREMHIQDNLKKIENRAFKDIRIESEDELQILILKYLGIYDILKGTQLSVSEFMTRVIKFIKNNFWNI